VTAAEFNAYNNWLSSEMKFQSYDEVVSEGVRALKLIGNPVTEATIRKIYPPDGDGPRANHHLLFMIWNVIENGATPEKVASNELQCIAAMVDELRQLGCSYERVLEIARDAYSQHQV
jgi:hypothetical protein